MCMFQLAALNLSLHHFIMLTSHCPKHIFLSTAVVFLCFSLFFFVFLCFSLLFFFLILLDIKCFHFPDKHLCCSHSTADYTGK